MHTFKIVSNYRIYIEWNGFLPFSQPIVKKKKKTKTFDINTYIFGIYYII